MQKKLIKIYGERNTNTIYLSELIKLNLDAHEISGIVPAKINSIQKILPGNELIRDLYFKFTFRQNLGWKHCRVPNIYTLQKNQQVTSNLVFITITKNPYSWLLSLYKKPYHQYYKAKPTFIEFLSTPWSTVDRDNCAKTLENPMELWNVKNNSYLPLKDLNGLNVTTEFMLNNPEELIDKISKEYSIKRISRQFNNYESSTKEKNKDFSYYQDYYINEKWRSELSSEAITIINASIDHHLMKKFGYEIL